MSVRVDRKIHPEDHRLTSQVLPSDDTDRNGPIFLSHPHTNNGFVCLSHHLIWHFYIIKASQKFLNKLGCDI